ncbi:hypothetical protein QYF61_027887 [Mycteria americana]|uniref:Mannosidase endo-alpha like n=1 Tax=Mycteria americana TaxID=33587 RepID=A0AAN7N5V4_MYCAM|nr:hypothetical protein QYF61_027887 [Mycteria americana]
MRPGPPAREGAAGRALGDPGRRLRRAGRCGGAGRAGPRSPCWARPWRPAPPPPGPRPSRYAWYGSPRFAGRYRHRDPRLPASVPRGRLRPPGDIGSSSRPPGRAHGPAPRRRHGQREPRPPKAGGRPRARPGRRPGGPRQARARTSPRAPHRRPALFHAAVGALVLSWHPPGLADKGEPPDSLVPSILDAAHSYTVKVAFHIQPYKGRDDHTVHKNIKDMMDKYRSHLAFSKYKTSTGKSLPLFYIYDSYLTPAESWASLLTPSGSHSLRNTAYNTVFAALLVEEEGHKHDILSAGVGPGYVDTSIRPWNNHNTRNRVNGKYYETALQAALMVRPEIASITSFSKWHEGTQIEKAVPKTTLTHLYLGYLPHHPSVYLELTHRWAEHFSKEKEQWLM